MTDSIEYRVLYADTDKMGVVYYANYLRLYEFGRNEFMRQLGFPYHSIELGGVVCPAVEVHLQYLRSAVFEDVLRIETSLNEMPTASMMFEQKIYRGHQLINEARIRLCFVDANTMKPVRCPQLLMEHLKQLGY